MNDTKWNNSRSKKIIPKETNHPKGEIKKLGASNHSKRKRDRSESLASENTKIEETSYKDDTLYTLNKQQELPAQPKISK